ncbi:ABC-F family ATP-binding cassette domain-containing protein [Latilactobacillus graminis]|uniref:ABC transporter family protein n=2 Tax=Latilactobacillus graminis TaxID=60519 RepID=A0AA89I2B1_9LACO|nr:ABC-F family ATP-binding cassette domain-containing protein [Latilactobacillus graminis]KRM24377.1 ABC transporter family protein [Latilactobacillus graminis DSM 20719]QFP80072.1 ABC-F family ATP-binding cassette domain-containing protein [Latilactobacillus graminis]
MILLQVQQVARSFGGDYLFKNAQLEVQDHARVALVGPNGAGKSTLLKMIAGITTPDEGQIILSKNVQVGYLAQDSGLDSTRTIYAEMLTIFDDLRQMETQMHDLETAIADTTIDHASEAYTALLKRYDQVQHDFSEANGYGYEAEIRGVLHGFQFPETTFEKPISTLSGGERSRLALAKLLLEKKDVLILDEPTNHLDIETLTWLENYLQTYPGALLTVSHDRYFLDKITKEVYDMSRHTLTHYTGNYSHFLTLKEANRSLEWKAYEKQQAEIDKLQTFVDKNIVRASTTKQAQSRRRQLEKMDKLDRPQNEAGKIHFHFESERPSGNEVLQVSDAAVGYAPDKIMVSPINFAVNRQERLAIIGPNGIGKSTLLKSILHQIPFIEGHEKVGSNVSIGYYDQEQHNLHPNKTVLNELWDEHPTTPEKEIRTLLGSFLFTGDDVLKVVAQLSGGEKARLLLTKLAMNHDNFLIMDEPTNHLDIDSKAVLEKALREFDGTVLFISHDRYFINQVATGIIELSEAGSKRYLGDYDYYLAKKAEEEAFAAADQDNLFVASTANAQDSYKASKENQRVQRKLEREVAALEAKMAEEEAQANAIQEQMTQADVITKPLMLQALQQDLEKVQAKLAQTEADWEEQAMALEALTQ